MNRVPLLARTGPLLFLLTVGVVLGFVASAFAGLGVRREAEPAAASMGEVEFSQVPVEPEPLDDTTEESEAPGPLADDGASDDVAGLDGCRRAVVRSALAVQAARVSLANWETHYGAQIAFDRGEIDSDEAERRWAESKAPATKNLAAYEDAKAAFASDDGCTQLDTTALTADERAEAGACRAQMKQATTTINAAERSIQGWRDHLDMMRRRDAFPVQEYLQIWYDTVAAAPGPMKAFKNGANTFARADGCDTSGVEAAALDRLTPQTVAAVNSTAVAAVAPTPHDLHDPYGCTLVAAAGTERLG